MELERVKATPFHRLQRRELKARKLLGRFNDDGQDVAGRAVRTRFDVCVSFSFSRHLPASCSKSQRCGETTPTEK